MAFSMACRWAPVYLRRNNFQGSVSRLSTRVTTRSTTDLCQNEQSGHSPLQMVSGNQSDVSKSSVTLLSEINDCPLSGILSTLSLSPVEANLANEYLFPSLFPATERASILDPLPSACIRECPTHITREIMERPSRQNESPLEAPPSARRAPEKRAKRIMKIRRKKMKKHKYLKWRKRNKFMLRAMFAKRKKKKQKIFEERLESYRYKGLTQDFIDWHMAKVKEEDTLFLKHLGIPLEEEETSEEHELTATHRNKGEPNVRILPHETVCVTPTPILPEGASLGRALIEQEQKAKELTGRFEELKQRE